MAGILPNENICRVRQIIVTGQSLALGRFGTGSAAATSNSLVENTVRGLTWNGGSFSVEQITTGLQQPSVSLVHELASDNSEVWSINTHAQEGASYNEIKQGTAVYNDALDTVRAANAAALSCGVEYSVDALVVIHGEADRFITPYDDYVAFLDEWQCNYADDIQAITNQPNRPPMFICQTSQEQNANFGYAGINNSSQSQLDAHVLYNDIFLVGPKYPLETHDDIHPMNPEYYYLGEYFGCAIDSVVIDGIPWEPLRPVSVVRNGLDIDITYIVPVAPIQFDTALIPAHPNFGFAIDDPTAGISSVTITGPNTVRVTLDSLPTGGNPTVRYEWGGNLRDSETKTSTLDGTLLPNWSVTWIEGI